MECGAYTKFQQVVSATKRHGLNTTEYIATCEDACVVIFGAGNQDISGIGAMIAFCIQAAAVVTSGPFLPLLLFTRYRRWLNPGIQNVNNGTSNSHDETVCMCAKCRARLDKSFERVLHAIVKRTSGAHLIFAIPLTVATIVQILQTPPVLEKTYLEWLVNVQMLLTMMLNVFNERYFDIGNKRASWLHIGLSLQGPLTLVATVLSTHYASPITNISELSSACHRLRGTIDILNEQSVLAPLNWTLLPSLFNFCVIVPLGFWRYKPSVATNRLRTVSRSLRVDEVKLQRLRMVVHHGLTILVPISLLIAHYAALFRQRRNIQRMAGDHFQDNGWGVGQTMAVIPWAWLVAQLSYDMWKIYHVDSNSVEVRQGQHDIEMGSGAATVKHRNPIKRLLGEVGAIGSRESSRRAVGTDASMVGEVLRDTQPVTLPPVQLQLQTQVDASRTLSVTQEAPWRRHQRASSA